MNFDKLRTVTELVNIGRKQEALLLTVLQEEPGSFKQFCQLVGLMNITEFKYRYNSEEKVVVLYSVGIHAPSELKQMEERMGSSQLVTHNPTDGNSSLELFQKKNRIPNGGNKSASCPCCISLKFLPQKMSHVVLPSNQFA